jgi:hypothetical protein
MKYIKGKKEKEQRLSDDSLCFLLYLIIYREISENLYSQGLKVPANVEITVNLSPADIKKRFRL